MASSDPAQTLYNCKTIYNTLHVYQVLEILDVKDEITEVCRLELEEEAKEKSQMNNKR